MQDPDWVWLDDYLKRTGRTLPEAICCGYGAFALLSAMRLESDGEYIRAVAKANMELRDLFTGSLKGKPRRRRSGNMNIPTLRRRGGYG